MQHLTWLTKRCGRRVPCECRAFRPSLWFPYAASLAHGRPAALTLARGLEYFLLCAGDLVPHQMCRAPAPPTDPHLVPPPSVPSPRPSSISRFLKSVDKFNDRVISAYVTATRDWPLPSPLLHLQLLHASPNCPRVCCLSHTPSNSVQSLESASKPSAEGSEHPERLCPS